MFLRSVDALQTSRAVSGRPTLVRFLKIAKKEETKPGAERLWPTGPAMRNHKNPIRSKYQPLSSERPIPVSVFMVPNNSEAYTRWPTLQYFRPTLQPRAWRTVKPGRKGVTTVREWTMCLPYLYHDLGVMIYEGPDKNQTEIMANILSRVVGHEGRLQPRDWTLPALIKVPYKKWNVYRMPVDRKTHIDDDKSRGFLHPRGLYELSKTAIDRWENDWMANMKAEGLATDIQIEVINNSKRMFLINHTNSYGVVNQTINGPRHTQVDAYVATATYEDTILMDIELHTVGTKRFLGSFNVRFRKRDSVPDTIESKIVSEAKRDGSTTTENPMISGNEKPKQIDPEDITEISDLHAKYALSSTNRCRLTAEQVVRTVWKLETKLWTQRERTLRKIEKGNREAKKQEEIAGELLSEAEEKEEQMEQQENAEKEA